MPAKRSRTGITLYQREENDRAIWWYDFRAGGRRYRKSTGLEDRGAAEAAALEARRAALEAAARPAVDEGVDLALLAGLDVERGLAQGIGPDQRQSLEDCWGHLCRVLGADLSPSQVDYDLAQTYIGQRRQEGLRGQSILKEIQCLKRGLKIARRKRWIQELPELPQVRKDPANKAQAGKLHDPMVLARWLEALDLEGRADGAREQAELVLRTGLRADEVRRLQLGWIEIAPELDGVAALLHVPADKAKNRKERWIGLTPEALALIRRRAQETGAQTPFAGLHRRAFVTAGQRIGYPQVITLRDLRHTHSTLGTWKTGDAAGVQAALGHQDLTTTQRYQSSTLARTAAPAVAVGELIRLAGHSIRSQQPPPSGIIQDQRVEAIGLEPTTSCLQSDIEAALLHLSECSTCASALLQFAQTCRDSGGSGHSDGHSRRPA